MNAAEDFGAVGALAGVKNPIATAYDILAESRVADAHGRISPMILTGRSSSLVPAPVDQSTLITSQALSEWKRWKAAVENSQETQTLLNSNAAQDTVGAAACTIDGDVSAGVSSGGLLLKRSGRIGEQSLELVVGQVALVET
ncbi:hypothetical protein FRC07_013037 [Ceratobasidium sp. 392]|nr:hypothetical protein FRC07_013037 [Ceratobasidium sp. 392]